MVLCTQLYLRRNYVDGEGAAWAVSSTLPLLY